MSLQSVQSRLSVEDLRLLAALGKMGSLSKAAHHLSLDHSSAYRRLGSMENRLGVRLFERSRDGYAPTPAGEIAIAAAVRLVQELGELDQRLAGADIRPTGVVRVTTTDTLVDLLSPILAEFCTVHSGIVLELVTANAFFTLTHRDADVAIRPATEAPEGLIARRIATIGTAFYVARQADRAKRPLPEQDWLAPDETLAHLGSARWIATNVPSERVIYRASSLLALRAAARAGLGVAPLPCFLGDVDPELVRVTEPLAEMAATLWMMTHPDLRKTARVRAFLDFVAPRLVSLRDRFEGGR